LQTLSIPVKYFCTEAHKQSINTKYMREEKNRHDHRVAGWVCVCVCVCEREREREREREMYYSFEDLELKCFFSFSLF